MELTNKTQVNKKATKRLASVLLASAMGVSAFGIVGCFSACTITSSQGTETTQPEDKPTTDKPNPDKPTAQYSTVLQNVLNDSYYEDVINKTYIASSKLSTKFGPTPLTFFARQGLDVNAYKTDKLQAESYTYMLDGDTEHLYLVTKAENYDNNNNLYYANYVLKYTLTKQEYEDFVMLHNDAYLEAGFFVQELDKLKTPEVLADYNVAANIFTELEKFFRTDKDSQMLLDTSFFNIVHVRDDGGLFLLKLAMQPNLFNKNNVVKAKRRYLYRSLNGISGSGYVNDILYSNHPTNGETVKKDDYKNIYDNVTYYLSQYQYMETSLSLITGNTKSK